MTLPSSGNLDFFNIQAEYKIGPSTPIAISSYYNGGSVVPFLENDNVPTSGQISMSNFYSGKGFSTAGLIFTTASSGGKLPIIGISETQGTWTDRTIKSPGSAAGNLIFESITTNAGGNANDIQAFIYESAPSQGSRPVLSGHSFVYRTSSFSGPIGFQFNWGSGQGESSTSTQSRSGPENGKTMRLHTFSAFSGRSTSGTHSANTTYYMTIT